MIKKREVFALQLNIENCGKISKANIEINGITVIAGENNTGKSTIGKVLYSVFNSFYDLDKKIFLEKKDAINKLISNFVSSNIDYEYESYNLPDFLHFDIEFKNKENYNEKVNEFIDRLVELEEIKRTSDGEKKLRELINERLSIDDKYIINSIFNNYIRCEFKGQINNLNLPSSNGNINLILKEKSINIKINNNVIEKLDLGCRILTEAVYIDSPFVMDDLNDRIIIMSKDKDNHRHYLRNMLKRNDINNLIEEAIISKKIDEVFKKINLVAPSATISKEKNSYLYKDKTLMEPINIGNVSTGLKTFVIIKMLIENLTIKEEGVLILDEPEIHLHPEWQLIFAEIIVLLQKELNLHIVLNTHSPYFLRAIEVFSEKHCITEKCKYYLACNNKDNISEINDVTNDIEKIYSKLANPLQLLEDLKSNLGDCYD